MSNGGQVCVWSPSLSLLSVTYIYSLFSTLSLVRLWFPSVLDTRKIAKSPVCMYSIGKYSVHSIYSSTYLELKWDQHQCLTCPRGRHKIKRHEKAAISPDCLGSVRCQTVRQQMSLHHNMNWCTEQILQQLIRIWRWIEPGYDMSHTYWIKKPSPLQVYLAATWAGY